MTGSLIENVNVSVLVDLLGHPILSFAVDRRHLPNFDNTIHPGQPIPIRWSVSDSRAITTSHYTATIYYQGAEILNLGNMQRGEIQPTQLPRDFYRIGETRVLTLRVNGPATDTGMWSEARLSVEIVGENIDDSWWEWRPLRLSVRWKQDSYTISITIHNGSQWSSLSGTLVLGQLIDQNIPYSDVSSQMVSVPRSSRVTTTFPAFTQAWPWFDRALLLPFGALSKLFRYSLNYTLSDEYGNPYRGSSYPSPVRSTSAVLVEVSSAKIIELSAAFTAQLVAIYMAVMAGLLIAGVITASGAGVVAALAAAFAATAQLLAMAALDPPEPDSRFLESVDLVVRMMPKALAETSQLKNVVIALQLTNRILGGIDALSQIEGRLIGARLAKSDEGIRLQTDSYLKIVSQMNDDTTKLLNVKAIAVAEIQAESIVNFESIEKYLMSWQMKGTDPKLRKHLIDLGLGEDQLVQIEEAVQEPNVAKDTRYPDANLEQMISALGQLVLEIRQDTPAILDEELNDAAKY